MDADTSKIGQLSNPMRAPFRFDILLFHVRDDARLDSGQHAHRPRRSRKFVSGPTWNFRLIKHLLLLGCSVEIPEALVPGLLLFGSMRRSILSIHSFHEGSGYKRRSTWTSIRRTESAAEHIRRDWAYTRQR